jgi:DNA-binding MltR family transcriptional regulator
MSKKKPRPGKGRRQVTPVRELLRTQQQNLLTAMGAGDPLTCVLIGAAYLENVLGSWLENFLINDGGQGDTKVSTGLLNDPFGPLGTFAARCKMCYALGLYSRTEYENLTLVGAIRNRFAHSHEPLDFDHEEIKALCHKLKSRTIVDQSGTQVPREEADQMQFGMEPGVSPSARDRFTRVVMNLWSYLAIHAEAVQAERRPRPTGLSQILFEYPPRRRTQDS